MEIKIVIHRHKIEYNISWPKTRGILSGLYPFKTKFLITKGTQTEKGLKKRKVCSATYIVENFEELYWSYFANCVFNAILSYSATMLNIVTIQALRKTASLPSVLRTLLLNLAVSDLGVGALVQPLYVAFFAVRMKDNYNNHDFDGINKAFGILANFLGYASFYGVTVLSADRFLAIHLHLRYRELVTPKRVIVVVVAMWIVSGFYSLLGSRQLSWDIAMITFVVNGAACLTATTFFYYKILAEVRRHSHQIHRLQVAGNGEILTRAVKMKKYALGTFYVYLVLLVCYFPQICVFSVELATGNSAWGNQVSLYTLTMILLNSTLSPLIYCWKMRHVRHAVMSILLNIYRSRSILVLFS